MEKRINFLIDAIDEVQETNRFLDTKAGALTIFETFILAFFVTNLVDESSRKIIQKALDNFSPVYLGLCILSFVIILCALLMHIILNLRSLFPSENPAEHVNLSGFKPTGLFFLYKLDEKKRIIPSIKSYSKQLREMSEEEIFEEYIFELIKLSYIRANKTKRLRKSFILLEYIFLGLVIFWIMIGIGFLVYT